MGAEDRDTVPEMYDANGEGIGEIPGRFMNSASMQARNNLATKAGFELVPTETIPFVHPAEAGCDDHEMHLFVNARKPVHLIFDIATKII